MVNALIGFLFLVSLVATIWVWIDASVNSSQSAVLWGLVAFFGGILGILLYYLLGRDGGSDNNAYSPDQSDLPEQYR